VTNLNLALKIDVDTERGTRIGVPQLSALLKKLNIPATFFFSLGPDNTGRALKRVFRRGFFAKVSRTSVVSTYGIRTLLNGILLPGPHIGKKHAKLIAATKAAGFSVGIHCYDHVFWQDNVHRLSVEKIAREFEKACTVFESIFHIKAQAAAAPGWQANAKTFAVYDAADLLYASDCRGKEPFFPYIDDKVFNTLQIPTTLPTLDELLGLPEYPLERIADYYLSLLQINKPNVLTIHAELEGMKYLSWFESFLLQLKQRMVAFYDLETLANQCLQNKNQIPVRNVTRGAISGRSGTLALAM